jgi:hypothetical protein
MASPAMKCGDNMKLAPRHWVFLGLGVQLRWYYTPERALVPLGNGRFMYHSRYKLQSP